MKLSSDSELVSRRVFDRYLVGRAKSPQWRRRSQEWLL